MCVCAAWLYIFGNPFNIVFFLFVLIIVFGSDGDEVVVLIMMHSFMIYILYIHVSPIGKS